MDLVEMSLVESVSMKTGMKAILGWAHQKAFWTLINVMFAQSAENLTPMLLKEKYTELTVYHYLYKVVELHSPENPKSLLGAETAKALAKLSNPALLCDVVRGIEWPELDIDFVANTKPSGK